NDSSSPAKALSSSSTVSIHASSMLSVLVNPLLDHISLVHVPFCQQPSCRLVVSLISIITFCSSIWPRPPLLTPSLPPDHQGENRPRYPGGWGSGVGSHRRCAITRAVTRGRGGRGQVLP